MTPTAPAPGPTLLRAIGRWDLTAAVINAVIGSAIFSMPSTLARLTGAGSPLAFFLAGLGVLTVVLCFAEVASRFRDPGGPYLYGREAFGSFVGFEAGWLTFWIRVTALAANLNVFVAYLTELAPACGTPPGRALTMIALTGIIAFVNVRGVRQATWQVDAFTLAKLLPLLLLVGLGLPRVRAEILSTQAVAQPDWTHAILLLVFAYGGFEAPLIPAGEAREPRRDSAFALLVALAVIASVYTLVQWTIVGVVAHAGRVHAPVAAAFRVLLGEGGVTVASLTAMVSVYGYSVGTVLQSSRVLFSMSHRGDLPALFSRVHPGFRTPDTAIVAYAFLALALALYGSFSWNATLSAIVRLLTYGLTCAALPVFRVRSSAPPGFRLPGAYLVVPLALAFCLWLLATRSFAQAWILAGLVAAGGFLWLLARAAWRKGPPAASASLVDTKSRP